MSAQRAFKARFDPELYEEIQTISKLQRSSINQFVTAAVRSYLQQSRSELISQYQTALEKLMDYARRDPDFNSALAEFAAAEVALEDPSEGVAVEASGSEVSRAERRLEEIFESA